MGKSFIDLSLTQEGKVFQLAHPLLPALGMSCEGMTDGAMVAILQP